MNKIVSLLPRNLQFREEAGFSMKVGNLMVSNWTYPVILEFYPGKLLIMSFSQGSGVRCLCRLGGVTFQTLLISFCWWWKRDTQRSNVVCGRTALSQGSWFSALNCFISTILKICFKTFYKDDLYNYLFEDIALKEWLWFSGWLTEVLCKSHSDISQACIAVHSWHWLSVGLHTPLDHSSPEALCNAQRRIWKIHNLARPKIQNQKLLVPIIHHCTPLAQGWRMVL